MSKNVCWQFGIILSLSSNDRICSFYWIRGSKHCCVTSFSNLYCYFLFLVFSRYRYLLVSLRLSQLSGNPISHLVFFIPLVLQVPRPTCALIFLAHMTCFLKARCSWKSGTRISTGFPFCLLPKVSHVNVRRGNANHTFSSHLEFLKLTFSCVTWASAKLMQYSSGKESPRDFQTRESRMIVACLTTASGWLPKISLHLFAFQWVPCTLFNSILLTSLTTKSFAVGSSTDPCHLACASKSVLSKVIPSIGCSTQLPRSAVGVMPMSWGWLLNVPFPWSSWSSGFLRHFSHDDVSERSLLAETLEGTLRGTPQVMLLVVLSGTTFAHRPPCRHFT